ncbi:uncharacterized protein LOC123514845 isoform X1 [Portunus trituberculatus]|uniref:uncharacterized protein LOC123514845 isoform X1 n=1 Tax=Portunus trituberculatus TaxID=210409 RepID=UPI001E1CBDAB|nr:uncharacterized protein LOC123514845 isoform X1 [Portunus trituberculatus]
MLWVKEVQSELDPDWETKYRRLGPTRNEAGVIVVGQRIPKWLKNNYDQDGFILLSPDHDFTKLYVESMHRLDHAGIEVTLAKIQSKFWVPKVRNMIKSVRYKCITCRKLRKEIVGQLMGQLPEERLKPSPPFTYTALDLYGPLLVKDMVKGRSRGKAYGVIFNCLATRAVHLDLIEGYSTKDFLDGLRRFVSIRGCPREIYSDAGTQLTAASKGLIDLSRLSSDDIQDFACNKGGEVKWVFNASADAPWQNGASESLIKSLKRSPTVAIGDNVLTFSKLQTTLFEISNILNERPIGIKPGCDPELGKYLCPNDLLLGRTSNKAPKGVFEHFPSHEYVDDILGNCDNYEGANNLLREIEFVLGQGGFKVKHWILSGAHNPSKLDLAETQKEKVLGVVWEPNRDVFVFSVKINFLPNIARHIRAQILNRITLPVRHPSI